MTDKEQFSDYETVDYHLVYAELIKAARQRGTVTYQELAHVVGLPPSGNHMGKRLGEILRTIAHNEAKQHRPMLTAIAVKTRGVPGDGFFIEARELELLKTENSRQEAAFWEDQSRQVYETWQQKFHKPEAK